MVRVVMYLQGKLLGNSGGSVYWLRQLYEN